MTFIDDYSRLGMSTKAEFFSSRFFTFISTQLTGDFYLRCFSNYEQSRTNVGDLESVLRPTRFLFHRNEHFYKPMFKQKLVVLW
jgi:hypothetical protein